MTETAHSAAHGPEAHLAHIAHWPPGVPRDYADDGLTVWDALAARARDEGGADALHFLGRTWRWSDLLEEAERLAGALQRLGLAPGERALMFMQNCPQFVVAFHAIARCGAVAVPVNPMNKSAELGHYIADAGARIALASADIAGELAAASDARVAQGEPGLAHLVAFDLAEALPPGPPPADWPPAWTDWLTPRHARPGLAAGQVHEWSALMAQGLAPAPVAMRSTDLVLLPYTSGTTGLAKGCMHVHSSLMHNARSGAHWLDMRPGDTVMVVVPMFHITGLVMGLLGAIRNGCRIVLLPRWDRLQAAAAIAQFRVTHWPNIPTMVIDLLGAPELGRFDLSSLRYIGGGGAAMPEAVARRLKEEFGLDYLEGYGLTETSAPTHTNPRQAPRRQCLGIPYIGVEARVVDPQTLATLPVDEVGEILVRGPQVFQGYWKNPQATRDAFALLEGKRWLRTGDLGRVDADGYFFMADRLKRMINASGFKVWPAEVEALLHQHPAVQEACIIARRDPYRGETVKAIVVPRAEAAGRVSAQDIINWARQHMAAYKYPREVEFAQALPKSGSGKILWRELQAREDERRRP